MVVVVVVECIVEEGERHRDNLISIPSYIVSPEALHLSTVLDFVGRRRGAEAAPFMVPLTLTNMLV